MKNRKLDTFSRKRVIGSIAILVLIILAFLFFMRANENRVIDTNAEYAASTTNQTAERIDDLLVSAQDAITMTADVLQGMDVEKSINLNLLSRLTGDSMFDYMVFCYPDGRAIGTRGKDIDVSKSDFFLNGMKGMSGVAVLRDEITGIGDVVLAYAPTLNSEGVPNGVFAGAFDEARMKNMLAETFLDKSLNVFLCESDGDIVAKDDRFSTDYTNVREIYSNSDRNVEFTEIVDEAVTNNEAASFTYQGSAGTGVAYIANLPNYDWMVLCLFPSAITANLVNQSNFSGFILLTAITVAFIIFIAILIVQGRKQNLQLRLETRELNRMVDAVTNLYSRFIYLDLENDTYEYLKTDNSHMPFSTKGKLSDYLDYWQKSVSSGEESKCMHAFLSKTGIRKELSGGKPFIQHEYIVEQDGEKHWMQASALVIKREVDEVETLLLAIQDIDELKKREEQSRIALEEAYNAAEEASKAKSDFLNSMSHDIRTPMNSIMGLTAIATMYIDDKERVRDCLQKITISSRHLLSLINEVLDMAKIESGTIALSEEDFDLSEAVESLLTIINPQVEAKHQKLRVDIANIEHEHVIGDPLRLQQVFVNIMGNSVKFTPEGGVIGFSIRELPSKVPGTGHFEFAFSDTGVGMSEEFVQRVFEPFARANDSRTTKVEGTGLGMSIVKSVVNLMNGTIDVKSKLGEGTTFTINLFLKLRDVEAADLSELEGLRVLVADDDELAAENSCMLLQEMGMESDYVLSGDAAIERIIEAKEQARDYVAVILDWRMPGKSGVETAREIRERVSEELPIIILSAYDWSAIEQEARATGVDAFISKPLFKSRLAHVMRELLISPDETSESMLDNLQKQDFSGYRILLVEDNALAASIAQDILGITHAQTDHAENGKVALEMVVNSEPGTYDLILMDIQMPIMNGYEAAQAIREQGAKGRADLAEIPIIALTADAFNDDVMKARKAGMNAHMSKPMEIENLIAMLNEWLVKREPKDKGNTRPS